MIVLLFQIHRKLISENIAKFVPQVIRTLGVAIERPPLILSNTTSLEQLLISENSRPLQLAFSDYISAQVKTLSFLAYILRGFANMLRPYHNFIPPFIIRVLRVCPAESAAARKV
jgi:transformation/transcription domain-associated protein